LFWNALRKKLTASLITIFVLKIEILCVARYVLFWPEYYEP
jgi:hypothetical protein